MSCSRHASLLIVAGVVLALASCGGGDKFEVEDVTFCHGLTENMEAVNPGSEFQPDETIYLSVTVTGRPTSGTVTAKFYHQEDFIAGADVDLASVNSGVVFSVGENTFVGYTLEHENPLPVGEGHRVELFYNGERLGTYAYRVVPPPGATPSKIASVTLARDCDDDFNPVEPTTTFGTADSVHLVGQGDLGLATWLEAEWFIGGTLDETGTRVITMQENVTDGGFSFSYVPQGGWPPGTHEVVLTMNGREVGRYSFTIEE